MSLNNSTPVKLISSTKVSGEAPYTVVVTTPDYKQIGSVVVTTESSPKKIIPVTSNTIKLTLDANTKSFNVIANAPAPSKAMISYAVTIVSPTRAFAPPQRLSPIWLALRPPPAHKVAA